MIEPVVGYEIGSVLMEAMRGSYRISRNHSERHLQRISFREKKEKKSKGKG